MDDSDKGANRPRRRWRRFIWRTLVVTLATFSLTCFGLLAISTRLAPAPTMFPAPIVPDPTVGPFPVFVHWDAILELVRPGCDPHAQAKVRLSHKFPTERWLGKKPWGPRGPTLTAIRGDRLYYSDGNSSTGGGATLDYRQYRFGTWCFEFDSQRTLTMPESYYLYTFTVPILPFAIAFGIVPALALLHIAWRCVRRRKDPNACRHCGYNLTGNLSGTCPECGSPVPAPQT
jgi:hypothetical protein